MMKAILASIALFASIAIADDENPLLAAASVKVDWGFCKDGNLMLIVTVTAKQQADDKKSRGLAWEMAKRLCQDRINHEVLFFGVRHKGKFFKKYDDLYSGS